MRGKLTPDQVIAFRRSLEDPLAFSRTWNKRRPLRKYQTGPSQAVANAIAAHDGRRIVWMFSRQAGKDETMGQLIAWILVRNRIFGGSVIVVAPTEDQANITRDRTIAAIPATLGKPRPVDDSIFLGDAYAEFVSIHGNIRGRTASLLLIGNEAQDIPPDLWDAKASPFTASTNAPQLFSGTAWGSDSLLARERRAAEAAGDGERLWLIDWSIVAEEVPAYGKHFEQRVEQLGFDHPFIKTEYRLIELGGEDRLFDPDRLAQIQGEHERLRRPIDGETYCALVDVAGSDELSYSPDLIGAGGKSNRDSTVLTIVRVNQDGPARGYEVVNRWVWVNHPASHLADQISDHCRSFHVRALVVDATGIGASLASFLDRSIGRVMKVVPFVFTAKSKSDLGWNLIAMIDTGRIKEYVNDHQPESDEIYKQLDAVRHEILPGPGRLLRWSVPASAGHDDEVMSLALVSVLDDVDLDPRRARGSSWI